MRENAVKFNFYPKLAWIGIKKNSRLYLPYMLTCVGMIMMYYILAFLAEEKAILSLRGGDSIQAMLKLGTGVIAVFSLLFLFYTNSFLVRRRKKEFGLYNILGMGKRNLAMILIWETVLIFGGSFFAGTAAGIAFSKLAELILLYIMQGEVTYAFAFSVSAVKNAFFWFAGVFFLILLNTLFQIRLSNPIALLRSENSGEKAPKANWFLGLAGAVLLGAAYALALSIENPLVAMLTFFVAVIMVMLATYLLFIAGSVVLCRMLQKNKKYYYKANHFVSVSSMAYRMKRNGAGLASICILITMVLVTLASTTCLYIGEEDIIRTRYPRNLSMDVRVWEPDTLEKETWEPIRTTLLAGTERFREGMENELELVTAAAVGYMENGCIEPDMTRMSDINMDTYEGLVQFYYVSLDDYNRIAGTKEQLKEDEALVYALYTNFQESRITVNGGRTYQVKEVLRECSGIDEIALGITPSVFIVVPDFAAAVEPLKDMADFYGNQMIQMYWFYGFDTDAVMEEQFSMLELLKQNCKTAGSMYTQEIQSYSYSGAARDRVTFFATFGGLFFIGIMLSIVFIFAAVLIIYYKQVSEGYEDRARFEIMQKVGMTKKDIRRSINSQMLTVFFLPLVTAGIHLCFAFPMIRRILRIFDMINIRLLVMTAVGCFLLFALFYMLIYKMTSNVYYSIVSKKD